MKDSPTIDQRFEEFHECNPHVYRRLRHLAYGLRAKGVLRYSIKGLFEVLRFEHAMTTDSSEPFKLNNDFTSRYARLLMEEDALADFFETREMRSQRDADRP